MILDKFNLTGKVALVTGCKRGIGKAMAMALAEAGADIIGVSASLEQDDEIAQLVTKLGRKFDGYQCNFSQRDSLYHFINQVKEAHPVIDILVNNAGTILRAPAVEHDDELFDTVMEVNLNAQFILSREIGKGMLSRQAGKIIFTASLLTYQGGITVPGYAASKGGIGQLTWHWPMSGPVKALMSMLLRRVISVLTILKRCKMIPSVAKLFLAVSRPVAGVSQAILPVLWFSLPLVHRIICTAQ